MKCTVKIVSCAMFLFFMVHIPVFAQNRYALVIGNGNYTAIEKLGNPANDAADMAAKLRSIGYQVELKTNAGNVEMGRAVNEYVQRLAQNKNNEGFFWYAGHGVQIDGENYLLPIDVDSADDVSVKYSSYPVNRLIDSFEKTAQNKVNIVVLDACRNNPFRSMPGKNRSLSRGLSIVHNLPPDLFIIYSTAAGDVAADGAAGVRNSPFAQAFIGNMESNDDISIVVRNITRETLRLTANKQRPYQEGSIISLDYYSLNPRKGVQPPAAQEDAAAYYNRGYEFQTARDWDRAIAEYTRAISIKPDYISAYWARGNCYDGKKEWNEMLADYTAAHRLDPNEPALIINIGRYYNQTGDYERAIAQFNEAIRMDPDLAAAYGSRSDAYRMLGDYDRAIADCDMAVRLDKNYFYGFGNRGETYRMKGDYAKALSDINEAIRLNPNFAWSYGVRSNVYRSQGKNDLADADIATYNRLTAAGY